MMLLFCSSSTGKTRNGLFKNGPLMMCSSAAYEDPLMMCNSAAYEDLLMNVQQCSLFRSTDGCATSLVCTKKRSRGTVPLMAKGHQFSRLDSYFIFYQMFYFINGLICLKCPNIPNNNEFFLNLSILSLLKLI